MKTSAANALVSGQKPLSAVCAALFALAVPQAFASVIVTSCADDGSSGTLRDAVAHAASGDTVDMTGLQCSSITLSLGELAVTQSSLTLQGPSEKFAIFGNIYHSGSGTLGLSNLKMLLGHGHHVPPNASSYGAVHGGCVASLGNVSLIDTAVVLCTAYADTTHNYQESRGGGVYTGGNLTMIHSYIAANTVDATSNAIGQILGGGACVQGNVVAKYSSIDGNQAGSDYGSHGSNVFGGGLIAIGNASIYSSSIVRNASAYGSGGLHVDGFGSPNTPITISNSTISGNDAPKVGGLFTLHSADISNSTIAFNTKHAAAGYSAGATFETFAASVTVNLHSTLIANNTYTIGGTVHENDISIVKSAPYTVTFTTDAQQGNFNLIRVPDVSVPASSLPPDTVLGRCPLLAPLADNGGGMLTNALYSGSPAIDAGINNLGLAYDQRGGPQPVPNTIPPPPLAYARHSGAATDIGAFEFQYSDTVFNGGFEGCP